MAVNKVRANKNGPAKAPARLWLRIGGLLVFVIAVVLILISFLNFSIYRKTYIESNLTRYMVLAKDVRQSVVSGLNIGLHPSEDLNLVPSMLEMARRYEGIRYIAVIDESGRTISQGRLPPLTAQAWKDKIHATAIDDYWKSSDARTFQLGLPFMNNFNLKGGAVVIGYDRTHIERAIDDVMRKMCVDAVKVLGLLTVLTLAGVYFVTRKFSAELAQVNAALDTMFSTAEPPLVADHLLGEDMARNINEFTAISHRAVREIARIEQELLRPANPIMPEGKA